MFVKIPEARATRSEYPTHLVHEGVYFFYEDHIGRPVLMTNYEDKGYGYERDADELRYWNVTYQPFGQINYDESMGAAGITVGTGDNAITWGNRGRLPI